jgi:hypothetical protein
VIDQIHGGGAGDQIAAREQQAVLRRLQGAAGPARPARAEAHAVSCFPAWGKAVSGACKATSVR